MKPRRKIIISLILIFLISVSLLFFNSFANPNIHSIGITNPDYIAFDRETNDGRVNWGMYFWAEMEKDGLKDLFEIHLSSRLVLTNTTYSVSNNNSALSNISYSAPSFLSLAQHGPDDYADHLFYLTSTKIFPSSSNGLQQYNWAIEKDSSIENGSYNFFLRESQDSEESPPPSFGGTFEDGEIEEDGFNYREIGYYSIEGKDIDYVSFYAEISSYNPNIQPLIEGYCTTTGEVINCTTLEKIVFRVEIILRVAPFYTPYHTELQYFDIKAAYGNQSVSLWD